ncbi:MAG: hypothetical protein Kow0067_11330 [Coriobacteriia bacterium]
MTAEIVIMNKSAVALAADSAVTVTGPTGSKVYNSANKLFMLTNNDPVGVMIYGSAQYMGMPWETMIKDFRESAESQTREHLEDYAQAFIRYISSADHLCDSDGCKRWALSFLEGYYANVILKKIEEAVEERVRTKGSISETQARLLAGRVVAAQATDLQNSPLLAGVTEQDIASLSRELANDLEAVTDTVFQKLPLSKKSRADLRLVGASLLLRQGPWLENAFTGVVIAGFGNADYYPRSYHFMPRARLNGVLYHSAPELQTIEEALPAVVQAFAQHEMVRTFLEGIDPRFRQAVSAWVAKVLDGLTAVAPQLGPVAPSVLSDFEKTIDELSGREFRNDVIGTVSILPKDELAAMAESLVNLTSFKRRVTMSPESVGGPIDVAVISKGDGFVWIKRKHYFEPELNPHFFTRYR